MSERDIYSKILLFIFIWAGLAFFFLNKVSAPYGKFLRKGWGPLIPNKIGWVIFETPSVLFFIYVFFLGQYFNNLVSWIFLVVWQVHYVHRTYVFPFRIKTEGKKNPLLIVVSAFFFTSLNSYLNARWISHYCNYSITWLGDWRFILGMVIFFAGLLINIQSDNILLSLRAPGEKGYKIPKKGLFKYVSGPNYFGELLIWMGWAMATWSWAGLAFFIFTFSNLIPRAISTHRWYLEKFPDYPKDRFAIIPGII